MIRPHTTVYYHDDPDGIFAAYAARLTYGENAEYVPWRAGDPIPVEADRDVIVLDLGLGAENLRALAGVSRTLLVIDHHASSAAVYAPFEAAQGRGEATRIVFDPKQAACVLSWQHFQPAEKVPEIVRYVADRDLWQWQLPHSREINAAIGLRVCGAADVWQQVEICLHSQGLLLNEGEVLARYVARQAELHAAEATLLTFPGVPDTIYAEPLTDIPCVNASRAFVSEVGERLLELHPQAPFVGCWQDTPGERTWELRSRPGTFDVGAYARSQGGGGHATAAGFRFKVRRLPAPAMDPSPPPATEAPATDTGTPPATEAPAKEKGRKRA